jgi:hypothetical protein
MGVWKNFADTILGNIKTILDDVYNPASSCIDVCKQDQTTPFNDHYFVQAIGVPTALSAQATVDNRFITVDSVVNISIGDWLGIFSGVGGQERYYFAEVMNIIGLQLEMQTLLDYPFPVGAPVISTTKNMAVDGSVVPQVFQIQAGSPVGSLSIDITRLMQACKCSNNVDLSTYADIIGGLTYGTYLRAKENGFYRNKIITRDNSELSLFAYDWTPFSQTRPNEGQDGYKWRFSLNGDDKHGVANRVIGNTNTLQWVVQDNLLTIDELYNVGANHEVD